MVAPAEGCIRAADLGLQPFVSAPADVVEMAAGGNQRRLVVEIDGDAQFFGDLLAEAAGQGHALGHGCSPEGNERDHVHGPDAGMLPPVLFHIDEGRGLRGCPKGCLFREGGRRDEREDGP